MTLHPIDPRHDEPCPECDGCGGRCKRCKRPWSQPWPLKRAARCAPKDWAHCIAPPEDAEACPTCHGTGTRGEGEACIEVYFHHAANEPAWYWEVEGVDDGGPYPTEPDALFAARCALARVFVFQHGTGGYFWTPEGVDEPSGPYPTRDAALFAALDAQR